VTKRLRPRIRDIGRITTADGAALAQYTRRQPQFGAVLRVLGPIAPDRVGELSRASLAPERLAASVAEPTQFVSLFPLRAAWHRGIAVILGAGLIPVFRPVARSAGGVRGPW